MKSLCNSRGDRRRTAEIDNLKDFVDWEEMISGLCSSFDRDGAVGDSSSAEEEEKEEVKNKEFEIRNQQWYINKISVDSENETRVVNSTSFSSWQVSMNVFIANATSGVLSTEGSTQRTYEQMSLQEAVLFTIADQPNNASEGKLGVSFYEPAIQTSPYFQALAEEDKVLFRTCSLPTFSNSTPSGDDGSLADLSAAFTLSSFESLEAIYESLDRVMIALLYGRRGDRRLAGSFDRDEKNLFTKTSQLSARLYSDALRDSGDADTDAEVLMMKTAVVCGDEGCQYTVDSSPSASPTMVMPTSMPTSRPTIGNTSSASAPDSALDIAAECGVICDTLARSSRLWSIYDAAYGDTPAEPQSINASTTAAAAPSPSLGASIYASSLEVKASVYLVWLCLLFVAWVVVLMAWMVKMCRGYGNCGEVCRLKICSVAAYSWSAAYYLVRNVAVTFSGGGVYAPEEHNHDGAPERAHGYGLSLSVLRLMQSVVVLVIILTRLAYIALLLYGTLERHLPSFVCMELAPYGARTVDGHDGFSLSSMASPEVLIFAASFFPLFLIGMSVRRAMTLQLMRLLNLGYLTSAPSERSATDEEEEEGQAGGLRSTELPILFRAVIVQAFAVGFGGIGVLCTVLMLSLFPSTREAFTSVTVQPACLAVIMAAAASATILQLAMSPCWMPQIHSLLTARLQQETLRRRDSLLSALSSMYSDDGRRQNTASSMHTRTRADTPSELNQYTRTADDSGHADDNQQEHGPGLEPEPAAGGGGGGATLSLVPYSTPTSRHSVSVLVDDSFVGISFTVMSITAVVATATTGYAWGSLLMYSGALRILEVFSTALLLGELHTSRNAFRSKLLKSIRERDREREREERQISSAA